MATDREFKARSIAKAVKLASKELGIAEEDVQYDIISHGASGIFGLTGVKKACIHVHLPDDQNDGGYATEEDRPYFTEPTGNPDAAVPAVQVLETGAGDSVEAADVGEKMLRRIVTAISPESEIKVERLENTVAFNVEGGASGILIGKRGQTLEAIQILVDKAVRRLNGHQVRVTIDVEGYLKNKEANLVRTAERVAQKVKSRNRPASIGFMNAQDRRIIHMALKDDSDVRTQSVGDGNYRKLMVYPRRRASKNY